MISPITLSSGACQWKKGSRDLFYLIWKCQISQMYLHIGVIVSTTFVRINYYSIHAERDLSWRMASSMRPSSLNSFVSCLSKTVNNIPNYKLSSSHIITVYVWYRSKALHHPLSLSHHRKLALFHSHTPHHFGDSDEGFPFLFCHTLRWCQQTVFTFCF